MEPSQSRPLNPSDISLFDPISPSTSPVLEQRVEVGDENKDSVSQMAEFNPSDHREPSPPDVNNWYHLQHHNYNSHIYENQQNRNQFAPNMMFPYYQPQYMFPQQPQMPMLRQLIQQPSMIPQASRPVQNRVRQPPKAPRRIVNRQRPAKLNLAWTYPAMISAALLNSRGPQKMDRIYAFMESHFLARLIKKGTGFNEKEDWRKCIRHTIVYAKQFESIAPEHSPRGQLYLIKPEKMEDIINMFRNRYEALKEHMTYPHLLDQMINSELVDHPIEYPAAYYELEKAFNSVEEAENHLEQNQVTRSQPTKVKRTRQTVVTHKKAPAQDTKPDYPELRRALSSAPQFLNPLHLQQYSIPSRSYAYPQYPIQYQQNNMLPDFGQLSLESASQNQHERVTPVNLLGANLNGESRNTSVSPSGFTGISAGLQTAPSTSNALPSMDTFSSLQRSMYSSIAAPSQDDQFPDDFLQ